MSLPLEDKPFVFQHDRLPPNINSAVCSWTGGGPSDGTGCAEGVYFVASLMSRSDSLDSSWRVLWTMFSCNPERREGSNKDSGCKDWTFWFAKCLGWSRIFSWSLQGNIWRLIIQYGPAITQQFLGFTKIFITSWRHVSALVRPSSGHYRTHKVWQVHIQWDPISLH
jgi:hypothetical protein